MGWQKAEPFNAESCKAKVSYFLSHGSNISSDAGLSLQREMCYYLKDYNNKFHVLQYFGQKRNKNLKWELLFFFLPYLPLAQLSQGILFCPFCPERF